MGHVSVSEIGAVIANSEVQLQNPPEAARNILEKAYRMLDNFASLIIIEAAGINCKMIELGIVDIY